MSAKKDVSFTPRRVFSMCLPYLLISLLAASDGGPAHALELGVAVGAGGAGSSWQGDGAAYSTLKLGVRGWDVLAPYFLAKLGWASVDSRLITLLSLGVQGFARIGPLRPYARFGFAHQHEEPLAYVSRNIISAISGVGDGIRHRAGVEGAVGVDWPLRHWNKWELFVSAEATTTWFAGGQSGPSWFWGGGLAVGVHYGL